MDRFGLLSTDTARGLYEAVKDLPIIDYHNHLSVSDLRDNTRFTDLYDLWIRPDPYKHRAMRMCGVEENRITGSASDFEKFEAWCGVYPQLIGSPLYIWTQMELQSVFGISELPRRENAKAIYDAANAYLLAHEITPQSIFTKFSVEFACPCVSAADGFSAFESTSHVAPSLRGDDVASPSFEGVKRLEAVTHPISCLGDYRSAITMRLDALQAVGCIFSDHALDNGFVFVDDDGKNAERFAAVCRGKTLSDFDAQALYSYMLTFLCGEYAKRNMTVQLHIGAQRFTSTRLRKLAGAAGGFAGIGNSVRVASLTKLLDTLERSEYGLPKMILFTLNPADNAVISVLSGSYAKDGVPGLITQGPAWWWCDHQSGIAEMLENASTFGLLTNFVGMTTDSRSFLSFVRHDYFRRVLCDWIGKKYEQNALGCPMEDLQALLRRMCCQNAKDLISERICGK